MEISENQPVEEYVAADEVVTNDVESQLAAAISDAEQRGYLRGRNERIEELMARPGLWQQGGDSPAGWDVAESDVMILNHPRRSIWDM